MFIQKRGSLSEKSEIYSNINGFMRFSGIVLGKNRSFRTAWGGGLPVINRNNRLIGLFIDIGIIMIIAVVILVRLFSAPKSVTAKSMSVPIRYTLELPRKNPDFKDKIKIGANVEEFDLEVAIGIISNFKVEPYLEDTPDFDNQIIRRVPVEGLETIYIEIETQAQVTDYSTLIGTCEVLVGKKISIITKDFAAVGYVVGIDRYP